MSETDELLQEFLAEAFDIIEKVNAALDGLLASTKKSETLDEIYRHVHTIKGASAMFNYANTKERAHRLETRLSELKKAPEKADEAEVVWIRGEAAAIEGLLRAQDRIVEEAAPQAKPEAAAQPAAQHATHPAGGDDYIRVPVDRVEATMNGVAEVFLIRNQIVYLIERFKAGTQDTRDFLQNFDLLDNAMRRGIVELERSAMSMRMMTVQGLFQRMARVVQSYNASAGKKITLCTEGESTELDKKVIDTLGEPLIHLVRNAMDHGIESREDRKKAGKPEQGTIELSAALAGNEVVIRVRDDGKGIDPQRILASAKKKGLDVSHVTDDRSAIDLIFLPGFSTAETVSEISGRGVGMDAVKSSVTALGGRVGIDTAIGNGSTFTINLPVSMSLIPAIIVGINGLKYAIPNHDILETKQCSPAQLKTNAGSDYALFRDSFIPCMDVRELVDARSPGHEERIRECSILYFRHGESTVAARVSSLERNTEVVVKPLPRISSRIAWVTGVSVLPTGEPIFVVSLPRLYESLQVKGAQNGAA